METVKELLVILVSSSLVSNVVLSRFLGLCPFLGVSKKIDTAAGMGSAIIFVITLSSGIAGVIYRFLLVPFHLEYLQTIVFILVIAALVQFVEMFLKKYMKGLYQALGVYLPLITTNCAVLCGADQCTEGIRDPGRYGQWFCHRAGVPGGYRDPGGTAGKDGL